MALTSEDRISISKKIIIIPQQNANADKIIAQIQKAKDNADKEDLGNKSLMDTQTALVNPYQSELQLYDGNGRTQLTEQNLLDSAAKIFQNNFFPNDTLSSLPSIPDGVWKNFVVFHGNVAIGKQYLETFSTVAKEQDLIDSVNIEITAAESQTDVSRSTGQSCITTTPPLPAPPFDTVINNSVMQTAATNIATAIQAWKDHMALITAAVPTTIQDPDTARQIDNNAAKTDIVNTLPILDTFLALPDFDTSHGQTTCIGFDAINVSLLNLTKFRADGLQPLKDEITARQVFIAARISQIATNLGGVVQDLVSGSIISTTGFYGTRFRIIDMRLNLIGGSLSKSNNLEAGQKAQTQAKESNQNAQIAYTSVMVSTSFRAPASGGNTIHVIDITGFSVSDSVFVMADTQVEIPATISAISGNSVTLSVKIPKKYRQNDGARLYKVL